ncbi:methyl-accepting chemotaxis protein [Maricaulaceae bacterium MS644]
MLAAVTAAGFSSWTAIAQLTQERLTATADHRASELSRYLDSLTADMAALSQSPATLEALSEFDAAFSAFGSRAEAERALSRAYIEDNPNPVGEKHRLDFAPSGSAYDAVHARFHPWLREFLERKGYYDIFLFNMDGDLVYSVFKEADYATNFAANGGRWAATDLGRAFSAGATAAQGELSFFDFAAYAPSYDAPASFLSTPLFENGERVGVLVFQMPIDAINAIMASSDGLGATGEAILVGSDGLLRNDSRFTEANDILSTQADLAMLDDAGASYATAQAYGARRVAAARAPVEFLGVDWSLVAVQDLAEVRSPLVVLFLGLASTTLVVCLLTAGAGVWISSGLTGPMTRVSEALRAVADGRVVTTEPADLDRADEIGDLARSLASFQSGLMEQRRLADDKRLATDIERRRQSELDALIKGFRATISGVMVDVSTQVERMGAAASAVGDAASLAKEGASVSSRSSEEASGAVASVSAAAEQLAASIGEIARQTETANSVVRDTVGLTERANTDVVTLETAARRIGAIIGLINDIAEQTNLLALNATIEAARAGEAGRGFAVVAQEVKALADQTSKATSEIVGQIGSVQTSTSNAVGALKEISTAVNRVSEISAAIATAIEEQTAVTNDISNSIQIAAQGTTRSAAASTGVLGEVRTTSTRAGEVHEASQHLGQSRAMLQQTLEAFLDAVSAETTDRRNTQRFSMPADVVVMVGGERRSARMVDLSRGGALVQGLDAVSGQKLRLKLPDGVEVSGEVVRLTESGAGIRFDAALDSSMAIFGLAA